MTGRHPEIGWVAIAAGLRRLILAAAGAVLLFATVSAVHAAPTLGVVKVNKLNLRAGPEITSRNVAVLERGTTFTIIEKRDGWLKVRASGRIGFLRARERYIGFLAPEAARATRKARKGVVAAQRKAGEIKEKIKASKDEIVTITEKEKAMVESLDQIDRSLNSARLQVTTTRKAVTQLSAAIADSRSQESQLTKRISQQKAYAAGRLVALYKLNRIGRLPMLASAGSINELVEREHGLTTILDHDQKVIASLIAARKELAAVRSRLETQKAQKAALDAQLGDAIRRMNAERDRRQSVLSDIRNRKSLALAALDGLEDAAKRLDRTIDRLTQTLEATVNRSAQPLTATAVHPAAGGFARSKGLLTMPVNGKIINKFGTYRNSEFNVVNFRSGIDIAADRGEPIHAVFGGRVLFANWFKGYGNMMIIDHGDHYYTVYAHMEEMFKTKGAEVEAGEVIATVGDTGSLDGPELHFEVRHHGKPLNPMDWIKKG